MADMLALPDEGSSDGGEGKRPADLQPQTRRLLP